MVMMTMTMMLVCEINPKSDDNWILYTVQVRIIFFPTDQLYSLIGETSLAPLWLGIFTTRKNDILRYSMKGVSLVYFSPLHLFKCLLKLLESGDVKLLWLHFFHFPYSMKCVSFVYFSPWLFKCLLKLLESEDV